MDLSGSSTKTVVKIDSVLFFYFLLLDQKIQKSRRKAISIFSSLKKPSQHRQKNMYIAPFIHIFFILPFGINECFAIRQNLPHTYQRMS